MLTPGGSVVRAADRPELDQFGAGEDKEGCIADELNPCVLDALRLSSRDDWTKTSPGWTWILLRSLMSIIRLSF
jgi:hypothetical protein